MEAALTRARTALAECAETALWALPDAAVVACLDTVTALATQIAAVQARLVHQIHTRDIPTTDAATSTAAWLRHRYRLSPQAATRTVELGQAIDRSPHLAAALTTAAITTEQATVIDACRVALPAEAGPAVAARAEAMLVEFAGRFDPLALRRLGRRILAHVDPDFDDRLQAEALRREQARAHAGRAFTLTPVGDGRVRLSGLLDSEGAATVTAALDPLCTPQAGDRRSPSQRRADALVEICHLAQRTTTLPEHGGDRPQIVITIGLQALLTGLGTATLDTGDPLTPDQARRLACDAHLIPTVLDGAGQVLDLGRTRRLVAGPLRRALALRDGGCAFPTCDRPSRWTDAHHVRHWADGGPTSLANTVLLCGHHHRTIHHHGWQVRIANDGHPEFIPPPHIDPQQHPRRHPRHPRPQRHPCGP